MFLRSLWLCLFALNLSAVSYQDCSERYTFRFLTNDLSVVDGRPVFTPDGKALIFMRQANDGNPASRATLWSVDIDGDKPAELFFEGVNPNNNQPFNATRPDYSWSRDCFQIAFDALGAGIWLLDANTKEVKQVLEPVISGQSYEWSYPSWYWNGKYLSVTNYNSYGESFYHELVKVKTSALNEFTPLTDNQEVWVGMSSVSQSKCKNPLITFAGQDPVPSPPPPCTCPGVNSCTPDGYAQNCNQIWIREGNEVYQIDSQQGRAPWFSPNGKYIVFESNRANPDDLERYRLFVYSLKHKTFKIVTPPALNVQHGKWSPDGKKIAFAVQLFNGAWGIAVVDLE